MKNIIPEMYLDNCLEALEYYKEVFGGEIKNVQMADDKEMFKGFEGKVVHSELHINENCIMYFVDSALSQNNEFTSAHLLLELDSEEEINRIYQKISKDGNVKYELQKAFWGAYHALVTDRYGNNWSLNYTPKQ